MTTVITIWVVLDKENFKQSHLISKKSLEHSMSEKQSISSAWEWDGISPHHTRIIISWDCNAVITSFKPLMKIATHYSRVRELAQAANCSNHHWYASTLLVCRNFHIPFKWTLLKEGQTSDGIEFWTSPKLCVVYLSQHLKSKAAHHPQDERMQCHLIFFQCLSMPKKVLIPIIPP